MSETTQVWQRQKGEQSKSFAYFQIYRDMGPTRSLQKVIDKISTNINKSQQPEKVLPLPTKDAIDQLSYRWAWSDRTIAYDNHLDEERLNKRKEQYLEIENDLIGTGKKLANAVKEVIDDLSDNIDDSKAISIANSLESAAKAYDKSVTNLRLLHGQSTTINDNNTKVEGKIESNGKLDSSHKIVMQPEFVELSKALLKKANHENNNR